MPHHSWQPLRCTLLTTLTLTLAACSTQTSAPAPQPDAAPYMRTVDITAATTRQDLEAKYGQVLTYAPQAGFAVVSAPAPLSRQDLGTTDPNREPISEAVEPNTNAIRVSSGALWTDADVWHSGGALWTDGSGGFGWTNGNGGFGWTNGGALWTDGKYIPLPQNSFAWVQVGLPQAHALAPKFGQNVKIAVIDTGIDLNHTAFADRLVAPSDMYDFVDNDHTPQEIGTPMVGSFGHGTGVAGIALQAAPNAKIMPLRVIEPDGLGDMDNVVNAVIFAVDHGAQIINLSLGSDQGSRSLQRALEYAASRNVLVFEAAGNRNLEQLDRPAAFAAQQTYAGAAQLSVGSVNSQDGKSWFSNYATTLELSAPGEMIATLAPGERVAVWSGTSMSTPLAAGIAALALGEQGRLNAGSVASRLLSTATNIDAVPANSAFIGKVGRRINAANFVASYMPIP
ncbi:S8 family serine peptidase [Deinococcus soli (ex Cha et al. 2016)]|uniref:Subtilisin family serine protease n=2 Tax=Deinococcus soli (ex Cha et al. 2016) TaxID=1309411 RepID=A0AAE3XBR0_9DEIO|nr:S8 family serine peptidase [Deinococcus soli (ex Cha et al. 2016)]MDR6218366.1 subtilisin family serine protease [Deinococcus soli (ex Cha et al. 2016)]MDR6329106.1 subtilisin family serine protease [Deinococcus soli (ex Cha et al. 2016)]MDR6751379.1 subtilisin family serine protease [Deinococcus soli (ex Cha et al. 2016)]